MRNAGYVSKNKKKNMESRGDMWVCFFHIRRDSWPAQRHIPPTTTVSPESRPRLSPQPSVFIKDTRTLTSMVALSNDMQSDGQRTARDVPHTDANRSGKVDDEGDGK